MIPAKRGFGLPLAALMLALAGGVSAAASSEEQKGSPARLRPAAASENLKRVLVIRSAETENQTHIKVRASAAEVSPDGSFPITTLSRSSLRLSYNGSLLPDDTASLATFDSSGRSGSKAIVWVYDANGVRNLRGLTKDLRTLTMQEFPEFKADFLSILGAAPDKLIERVHVTPSRQENILALQRLLIGDPSGIKPAAVLKESPVCAAASKFEKWLASGLKLTEQKALILMGGSRILSAQEHNAVSQCTQRLRKMQVAIHQIIFARPENLVKRKWISAGEELIGDSIYRVVDMQGAVRAIQASRNSLAKEYIISAQIPAHAQATAGNSTVTLQLLATYYGKTFHSDVRQMQLSSAIQTYTNNLPASRGTEHTVPARIDSPEHNASLAVVAWIEWLLTAFVTGLIVTVRHIRRQENGIFSLPDEREHGDTSQGPLILVLNGSQQGREYRIRQKSVLLGTGLSCDLRLSGRNIRRKHGRLLIEGDKALLEDFSDGNLSVNGRPIRQLRVIGHGSVIRLGDLQLLFRCGEV